MFDIDVIKETDELTALHENLSKKEVDLAIRRSINTAIRRARVKMKKDIRKVYNIPASVVNKQVLKEQRSYGSKHQGAVLADKSTLPISVFQPKVIKSSVTTQIRTSGSRSKKRQRRSKKEGVFVTIVKGKKQQIPSAFLIYARQSLAIMARGKYSTKKFNFGKARLPISALKTKSVFFATQNKKVSDEYIPFTKKVYLDELERQLELAAQS